MFSHSKGAGSKAQSATTLISVETTITGDLHFSGSAHVDGTIHGNIFSEHGQLVLANSATVEGDIHAQNIVIHGTVNGNVYADEFLELISGAIVNGKVFYNVIEVANGARVNGSIEFRASGEISRSAQHATNDNVDRVLTEDKRNVEG